VHDNLRKTHEMGAGFYQDFLFVSRASHLGGEDWETEEVSASVGKADPTDLPAASPLFQTTVSADCHYNRKCTWTSWWVNVSCVQFNRKWQVIGFCRYTYSNERSRLRTD
jgi:hypothetical protein